MAGLVWGLADAWHYCGLGSPHLEQPGDGNSRGRDTSLPWQVCQHGQLLVLQPITASGKEDGATTMLVTSAWNQRPGKLKYLLHIISILCTSRPRTAHYAMDTLPMHLHPIGCLPGGKERPMPPCSCAMRRRRGSRCGAAGQKQDVSYGLALADLAEIVDLMLLA